MEVFFVDVGQGMCHILLLGGRRAIILDCGIANDLNLLRFLRKMGVESIACVVVSHSHNDHMAGAVSVLGEFRGRIERICFVQDDKFLQSEFWVRIAELLKEGEIDRRQLVRLELTNVPQVVWSDEARFARLLTISPTAAENLLAQNARSPNATSAILVLEFGERRIVFASDSVISQWREIRQRIGRRLRCDVLAVPHHGGQFHDSPADLAWLFEEALSADVAVISVGTSNEHGHPRQDVVQSLTAHGAKVMCTQITSQCHIDLESLRPAVLQPILHLGRSSPTPDRTRGGASRNVACAGTVRVSLTPSSVEVDRLDQHQQAVDHLAAIGPTMPLCRLGKSSASRTIETEVE